MFATKIITISGWKYAGKDTTAELLKKEIENISPKTKVDCLAIADTLKSYLARSYSINTDKFYSPQKKESALLEYPVKLESKYDEMVFELLKEEFRGPNNEKYKSQELIQLLGHLYWTPRALCLLEGNIKRSVNSDFWIDKTIKDIQTSINFLNPHQYEDYYIIVTDVRLKREIEKLKSEFSNVKTLRIEREKKPASSDITENDLNDYNFDVIIENKSDISFLTQDIKEKLYAIL